CTPVVGTKRVPDFSRIPRTGIVATQLCVGSPDTMLRRPRGGRAWPSPRGQARRAFFRREARRVELVETSRACRDLVQRGVQFGAGARPRQYLDGTGERVAPEEQVRHAGERLRLDGGPGIRAPFAAD